MKAAILIVLAATAAVARTGSDTIRSVERTLLILGPEEDLAGARLLGSTLDYFPDEAVARLPAPRGAVRLLLSGGISTWVLEGQGDLGKVAWKEVHEVLRPDSSSQACNGYLGASGAWSSGKDAIWALTHEEDHKGLSRIAGTEIPGFYATIGRISSLDGLRWRREGTLIRSMAPKVADPTRTDQGAGEPGLVETREGDALMITWTDHGRREGRGTGICLARIPLHQGVPRWDDCKKWDGSAFEQPCDGGADIVLPLDSLVLDCRRCGDVLEGHPVWIEKLHRYAMVFGIWAWKGLADTRLTGTWIAFSADMIHWNSPAQLWSDPSIPVAGAPLRWEATLLLDASGGMWIVYGVTPAWPDGKGNGRGHSMARRKISWLVDHDSWPLPRRREPPGPTGVRFR